MAELTRRVVGGVATDPSGQPRVGGDSEGVGFGPCGTPAGTKSYIVNYRTSEGRERRYTIGKHGSPWTCDEARAKAIAVKREIAAGIDPLSAKAKAKMTLTVADLAALYLS